MPITMDSIFMKARALLDEYTEEGISIAETDVIDMQKKAILFADMAQKELYALGKMEKTFTWNNKPVPNLLGYISEFNSVDFIGTDQSYPPDGIVGAKAYYFESTGSGTAYIEEYDGMAWNALVTVNMPIGEDYVAYKGVISPSDASYPVRLRFSGTTFYRHINRALFSYPFTVAQLPDYKPWVPVTMPSDFMDINQVISEFPDRQYNKDSLYKWEEPDTLYMNYYYDGQYRMVYNPIPATITAITDTLQCNEVIGQAISYYVAARLAFFEGQQANVNFFESKYFEMKTSSAQKKPLSWEQVKPTYTIGGVI